MNKSTHKSLYIYYQDHKKIIISTMNINKKCLHFYSRDILILVLIGYLPTPLSLSLSLSLTHTHTHTNLLHKMFTRMSPPSLE